MTLLFLALSLTAGAAHAQSWPGATGATAHDRHRLEAERHRAAVDGLRRDADARDAQAWRARTDSALAVGRTQAARAPDLPYPDGWAPAPAAPRLPNGGFPSSQRRPDGLDQIDAWLSRRD